MGSAKQKGFVNLEGGSIGETTFFKTKNGYRAREKKNMSSKRWKTAPEFARSRESAEEFGMSSSTAKLLKYPLHQILGDNVHTIAFQRLKVFLSKLILVDDKSLRGKRYILPENAPLLIGFELNGSASLRSIFNTRFLTTFKRETGELSITIPSFIPTQRIKAPKGTTHFRIIAAGSTIDFAKVSGDFNFFKSEYIPFDTNSLEDMEIKIILPPASTLPVFAYLSLTFWQIVLGETHPVAQYRLNPAAIVNVFV